MDDMRANMPAHLEQATLQDDDNTRPMEIMAELYESPRPSDQTNQSSSESTSSSSSSSDTKIDSDDQTSSQMQVNNEQYQQQNQVGEQYNDQQAAEAAATAKLIIKRWPRTVNEVRLLVRRREAGALIGKKGANIKRLRDQFHESSFNIPDTGNGPERVVIIAASSMDALESILLDVVRLFQEKQMFQPTTMTTRQPPSTLDHDPQVEMKMLINSSHAGLLIGVGGQSIRKLRNVSFVSIYQ